MELLKKIMPTLLLFCMVHGVHAQDYKAIQSAFEKSLSFEGKQDYTNALDVVKPYASTNTYEINIRLGWLYYLNGKNSESITYYNKAIVQMPAAIEPLLGIAYPLGELKKWTELSSTYKKILKLDPKNTTANYRLGLSAYYNKDYITAKKYFDIVLGLYPMDYNTLLMSAWTNYFLGNKSQAKILFNKVLMISPDDTSATEGLGLIK